MKLEEFLASDLKGLDKILRAEFTSSRIKTIYRELNRWKDEEVLKTKRIAKAYGAFCAICERENMPLIEIDDFINLITDNQVK